MDDMFIFEKKTTTTDHEYEVGPTMIMRQQLIFKTIKMQIPQNED